MTDIVDRLRDKHCCDDACHCDEAADEIERLRAALGEIAKHPRGGRIDTPEKLERDEMIGIARAALANDVRITAQPAAPGGEA